MWRAVCSQSADLFQCMDGRDDAQYDDEKIQRLKRIIDTFIAGICVRFGESIKVLCTGRPSISANVIFLRDLMLSFEQQHHS